MEALFKTETIRVNSSLKLQRMSEAYTEDLFEILCNEENTTYILPMSHTSIEETEFYIRKMKERMLNRQAMYFGIVHEPDDTLYGYIAIHSINERSNSVSIGYMIRKDQQRKNITYQCVCELIRYIYATTTINRISATVNLENIPSQKLLQKLKFQEEGILRKYSYNARTNQVEDRKLYSIIREDSLYQ